MTHSNSGGKNAIRLNIIRADQAPEQLLEHNRAPWPNNYFSLVWTEEDQCCLYVHDEHKPGGYRIACTGDVDDYAVVDFELVGDDLILTDSAGGSWTVDLGKYLDDTFVDEFYLDGDELVIGQTGPHADLRLSLTALLAPLLANVVESPAGRFSFYRGGTLIEQWWQGGFTTEDGAGNVTITNPDGSTVVIPFQELATYGIQFTADGKVQFLINGVVDKTWQQGAQVDQLADGLYRATNFAGNIVTWYGLKDATLASIDEAAGTVTIQNPDGSLVTFGIGNEDMELLDASVADGVLTIEKTDNSTVIHRQTRVQQSGPQANIFTANHRATWPNVAWTMPYVTRPSSDVAMVNIYNHETGEWEEVAVVTPEDVVILNNPVIYIRKDTGSANPPISQQSDLTIANAFNSFDAVRTFMNRTLTVGTVTLDVRGDFTESAGNIGPTQFKNAQTIVIRGDSTNPALFKLPVGRTSGASGLVVTSGLVILQDVTGRFYDESEAPTTAPFLRVLDGEGRLAGNIRFEGTFDVDRPGAGGAFYMRVESGAKGTVSNTTAFTINMTTGAKISSGFIALAGGDMNIGGDVSFNLVNSPDFTTAFIDIQSGATFRSVVAPLNSPQVTGAGRAVAPNSVLIRPLSSASIAGGSYGSRPAIIAYDWGVNVAAGGAQANMAIDAIGVLNNIAGP